MAGLLSHNLSDDFQTVAETVYQSHFDRDPKLSEEYDDYRKEKMYEDILHNLSFLEVSYVLDDNKLFSEYAIWLLELMVNLMPDLSTNRIKEQMVDHYTLLDEALKVQLKTEDYHKVHVILDGAITKTKAHEKSSNKDIKHMDKYQIHRDTYLDYLLAGDGTKAINYITQIKSSQLPLEDIYVDILQPVMTEVGHLWHQNKISVDEEHYITSLTQVAMSQFYNDIFSTARIGRKILACSVGSELHEMGARMISDLFEYHGWDSIYLGASVPEKALLSRIEKERPEIIALSVTMPQHLTNCYTLVKAIKALPNPPKIAVGGRAFSLTDKVWEKWPVDISTSTAKDLLNWAEQMFKS